MAPLLGANSRIASTPPTASGWVHGRALALECTPTPSVIVMTITEALAPVGIGVVSAQTGLSPDTLRWYEKEGLLPAVERTADGRRVYPQAAVALVRLVQVLRRTGMPVADVRRFISLMEEGAASHGRRMTLLEEHAAAIGRQLEQLTADLGEVQNKITHYRALIGAGLDCEGSPVDEATAARQQIQIIEGAVS